jgi:hypothetical protein
LIGSHPQHEPGSQLGGFGLDGAQPALPLSRIEVLSVTTTRSKSGSVRLTVLGIDPVLDFTRFIAVWLSAELEVGAAIDSQCRD